MPLASNDWATEGYNCVGGGREDRLEGNRFR